jgi:hypothetical protein
VKALLEKRAIFFMPAERHAVIYPLFSTVRDGHKKSPGEFRDFIEI